MTAKSTVIKGGGGKSGRCAGKAVRLTSGDLCCVLKLGLRGGASPPERGAEVRCLCGVDWLVTGIPACVTMASNAQTEHAT